MNKTFTALIAVAMALSALAVDTSIAYQGVLKNAAGTAAITGAKNITFALYTVATGGTAMQRSSACTICRASEAVADANSRPRVSFMAEKRTVSVAG